MTPDYMNLVNRVKEIDREAAVYLFNEAPKLEEFNYRPSLLSCFCWDDTPQGHVYWNRLYRKLQE